jgi:hypothetical protein
LNLENTMSIKKRINEFNKDHRIREKKDLSKYIFTEYAVRLIYIFLVNAPVAIIPTTALYHEKGEIKLKFAKRID